MRLFWTLSCCFCVLVAPVHGLLLHNLAFSGVKLAKFPICAEMALTRFHGTSKRGTLPWRAAGRPLSIDRDVTFYESTLKTTDPGKMNAVLMNIQTWQNIPEDKRPLPGRLNVIVSKTPHYTTPSPYIMVACNLIDAIDKIEANPEWSDKIERAVVIGGAQLYEECVWHPSFDTLDLVQTIDDYDADEFLLPNTIAKLSRINWDKYILADKEENGVKYR